MMAYRPAPPACAARIARSSPRAGDPIPGHIGPEGCDDAALIAAVARGDAAALDQLFLRHRRAAFGVAFALLRDPHAAEDAVHDTFLSVWRSARTFRPERGQAKSWIQAIARNMAIDLLRARQLTARQQSALVHADSNSQRQDDVAAMVVMAAEARRLRAALASLPPSQRVAVELAYFAELTHSQIAEQTRTPLGTVKGRIRLGLKRLRQDLGAAAGPSPGSGLLDSAPSH
jgi:RNA polymerase sigma-70 factor, ECF subfamily